MKRGLLLGMAAVFAVFVIVMVSGLVGTVEKLNFSIATALVLIVLFLFYITVSSRTHDS